jgi:hypothetical protein
LTVTANDRDPKRKYEERDANFSRVMTTAAGLLGVMVVGLLCAWAVYALFTSGADGSGLRTETFVTPDSSRLPAAPNLEADPHESLVRLRAGEDSVLHSYGWTDSARGIDRAKELYLQQGKKK